MTTLTQALNRNLSLQDLRLDPAYKRASVALSLLFALALIPGGLETSAEALADAYLAVSVFVAGTIALVLAAERGFGVDLPTLLNRHRHWQVPAGVLLGTFPGCGGAIIAVTQYSRGHLSFGGLVATLIATMGDAMFLLLAQEPATAGTVMLISGLMGLATGYGLDAIHGPGFLRPAVNRSLNEKRAPQPWLPRRWRRGEKLWLALMAPGLIIGLLQAFQLQVDQLFGASPALWIGLAGSLLALAMWVVRGGDEAPCLNGACEAETPLVRRIIDDTNFVSSWVIFAFLGYELAVAGLGIDLSSAVATWGALIPAAAILVGFIPGCGPQILITSLYLGGTIPLSAQLGNAISNDGDALFPALAVAPRAALVATLYSALPALLTAYVWYMLVEG